MKDEIIAILDRSGSMTGYESATISGYNDFIKEQRKLSSDAAVTLILFDNMYEVLYEALPIDSVRPLTVEDYYTRGSTALRDAIGRATDDAGFRFNKSSVKPEKVLVYINTDGYENASKEYSEEKLKGMVKHQEEKYGWQYIYAGCDHDVFASANAIGIKSINTFVYDKNDLKESHDIASRFVSAYRK